MEITACVTHRKNIRPLYKSDWGEVYFSPVSEEIPENFEDYFTERELVKIKRLYRNRHRVAALIKGRIMLKKIIRNLHKEEKLACSDIEIINCEDGIKGAPVVYVKGQKEDVGVSVSYTGNYVSVALSRGASVGVDIETVHEYSLPFLRMFYSKEEIKKLVNCDEEKQTESWCIKEAVLKALGTGFGVGVKKLKVTENDDDDNVHIICRSENNICQVICYVKEEMGI